MPKIISFLLFLVLTGFAYSQTPNSVLIEGNPYGNNPYPSIAAAISDANNGDVILIRGIHTESISFGKSITLRGTDPTKDILQAADNPSTDGSGTNVINVVRTGTDVLTVNIENLGIRNGNDDGGGGMNPRNGGGINIDKVTGLITLKNLIIENNHTSQNGGGIGIAGSNVDIIDCTIRNNSSSLDGGGFIAAPNNASGINNVVNIQGSLIDNNTGRNGGGMYINGNLNFGNNYLIDVNIVNSTISNNEATSAAGGNGGGAIWARAETWTAIAGGDGTSANVRLNLIHATLYNNSHAADIKSGIHGTGSKNTEFSAYNSIIVAADVIAKRAINFANLNTIQVKNCILGGLNSPPGPFLDDPSRNNKRGRTATEADLSGVLTDEGGYTEVITIEEKQGSGIDADDFCTAIVTEVTLPTVDQRGYEREGTPDCGAYEFGASFVCKAPESVTLISLASTAASFTWANNPDAEEGYEWVVVLSGGNPENAGEIVVSGSIVADTLRASATGLTDGPDYDFYVRAVCSTGVESDWSSPLGFTPAFQGNLIKNARFTNLSTEDSSIAGWEGFGTGPRVDNILGRNVGFINLSDGTFRQDFVVVPGVEYAISFNYRWVSNSGGTLPNALTPVVADPNIPGGGTDTVIQNLPSVQTDNDIWYSQNFLYTHDVNSELDVVRLRFFKAADINQFVLYNVTVLENKNISTDYDFVYKNGAWSPSIPNTANDTQNVYVFNGWVNVDAALDVNDFIVSPWADVEVENLLKVFNEFTVEEGGVLTFKSDDTQTAMLGNIGTASVNGKVTVERRIPQSNRAFRYMSSPVTTARSIRDNLQERQNNPNTATNLNTIPGFGTHITGSSDGEDGFDATQTGNSSMFTWNPSGNPQSGWEDIPNTNTETLNAGDAFALMIRGDRSTNLNSNAAAVTATTLRFTGELEVGDFPVPSENFSTVDGFFNLIGNPYQSQVDLKALLESGDAVDVNDTHIYIYDPTIGTAGGYATVDLTTETTTPTDPANSGESTGVTKYLQPNQAFFVTTIDSNADSNFTPGITFKEQYKQEDVLTTGTFSVEDSSITSVDVNLKRGTNDILVDGVTLQLHDSYADAIDYKDAVKFWNLQESIAMVEEGAYLSINKKSTLTANDTLALFVYNYQELDYTLALYPKNINTALTTVYLQDHYLDQLIALETDVPNAYAFSIDPAIPASADGFRFSLIFEVETLSSETWNAENNFTLYPNPISENRFFISAPDAIGKKVNLEVMDSNGRRVFSKHIEEFNDNFQIKPSQEFSTGLYFVKLSSENSTSLQKLLVN